MLIRPELQMLRSDDAPQRTAQRAVVSALHVWRTKGDGAEVEAELARFHRGAALEDLPLMRALFDPDCTRANRFLGDLIMPLLHQIAKEPLAQSPLRHSTSDVSTAIVVARCATSALTLHCTSGTGLSRQPEAETASFFPAETWERVLAGSAEATQVRLAQVRPDSADLEHVTIRLGEGDVRHRNGRDEALLLRSVPTSLVQLRLQRRTDSLQPVRQYRLADGALVHQAAGTPRDSRLELTAALLGRMKRRDAAPMLAAMAEERGSDGLRWQVLRECLALNTATGFGTLATIADRADDSLRQPAMALRATLIAMHPELQELVSCPV